MIRLKVIESNFNNLFLYLGKSKKEGKDLNVNNVDYYLPDRTQVLSRVNSKTQFYFLFSFCLVKKKQKPNPPAGGQLLFFIAQKASAAPPKKS
jgi:hypothetical protein